VRDPAALAAAIGRLVADADERERMGRAGRERMLARFDEEVVVERTLEVYGRLLARRRR
jgi:glycosyltransferase involved in cell wall biosynthesis